MVGEPAANDATRMIVPVTCRLSHTALTLANGVKVIIVEDPTATRASAAMNIAVGTNNDPPELPGLAHLCEHMLFLGTQKYPEEGDYDRFITHNGGMNNAWTSNSGTNFYFTIGVGAFEEALDRFVQFFVAPTFTPSGLEREVRAVHSEDEKNHDHDYWRCDELLRMVADPEHPRHRYGNGNIYTLWEEPRSRGVDVRAELLRFYERYYVAEAAAIAVYSKHSVADVLRVVEPALGQMRPNAAALAPRCFFGPARNPISSVCGRGWWYNLRCVRSSVQQISLRFPVPFSTALERHAIPSYVSHVIGHECSGSLLAALKARGFAEELVAGCSGGGFDDEWDVFVVTVQLTQQGLANLESVIDIAFDAVALLQRIGKVDEDTFQDAEQTAQMMFDLQEIADATSHVSSLCSGANTFGLERAWCGNRVTAEPDRERAFELLKYLTPDNCVFVLMHAELPSDEAEPMPAFVPEFAKLPLTNRTRFHQAPYSCVRVPEEHMRKWRNPSKIDPLLALPSTNPFVTTDFSLVAPGNCEFPTELPAESSLYGRVWVKADDGRFRVPHAFVRLQFESAGAYTTALQRFFTRVWVRMAKDLATEVTYFATLASLESMVVPAALGPEVTVTGPARKLRELVRAMTSILLSLGAQLQAGSAEVKELYQKNAARVLREVESMRASETYILANELFLNSVHEFRHPFDTVAAAGRALAEEFSFGAFCDYFAALMAKMRYDMVATGNVSEDDVRVIAADIDDILRAAGALVASEDELPPVKQVHAIAAAQGPYLESPLLVVQAPAFNPSNVNSAVQLCFQVGPRTPRLRNLGIILSKLASSLFFDCMRTKETLGYSVFASFRVIEDSGVMAFVIQSAAHGPPYLLSRIFAFLEAFGAQTIAELSATELEKIISAEMAVLRDYPKSVAQEGQKLYSRRRHPIGFEIDHVLIEDIQKITVADVRAFFAEKIGESGADRRAIATFLFGKGRDSELLGLDAPGAEGEGALVNFDFPERAPQLSAGEELSIAEAETDDAGPDANGEGQEDTPASSLSLRTFSKESQEGGKRILVRVLPHSSESYTNVKRLHCDGRVVFPS